MSYKDWPTWLKAGIFLAVLGTAFYSLSILISELKSTLGASPEIASQLGFFNLPYREMLVILITFLALFIIGALLGILYEKIIKRRSLPEKEAETPI